MEEQLLQCLVGGPRTAIEIGERLACSQPSVSRHVRNAASRVLAFGRARATRYGLRRAIRSLEGDLPVYRIDRVGRTKEIGTLAVLHGGIWYQSLEGGSSELFPGLPWFIADMRPQGFVGRTVAAGMAELGTPSRLADWTDDHALYWLALRGEDAIGNLIVGEESMHRYAAAGSPPSQSRADYPELASLALAGEPGGSSAGGEQPKFTVRLLRDGAPFDALVKFSDPLDTAAGRRWGDLLICESLASEVLAEHGFSAALGQAFEAGGRMFLEVKRFDRTGVRGRLGVFSLGVIDDHFVGRRASWHATALDLLAQRKLDAASVDHIAWLSAFGAFIANTDMHFGNLSLRFEGQWPLQLAPVYDMLPMLYAPQRAEVRTPEFTPRLPLARALEQSRDAQGVAVLFWRRVAGDSRVSADFRVLAADNAERVARLSW